MPELTPQQKLLEKLYRESTAKKPPSLQQKRVKKEDIKVESQAQTEIAKVDFAKDETND